MEELVNCRLCGRLLYTPYMKDPKDICALCKSGGRGGFPLNLRALLGRLASAE